MSFNLFTKQNNAIDSFLLLNNIEVYEEPVTRPKIIVFKFQAGVLFSLAPVFINPPGPCYRKFSGGSNGAPRPCHPPRSKFFHFHAVFGEKIGKLVRWRTRLRVGVTLRNPGSATKFYGILQEFAGFSSHVGHLRENYP